MLVTNGGNGPADARQFRRRIDHVREEYLRTCKLLEQEGRRLTGFQGRISVTGGNPRREDSDDSAGNQALLAGLTTRERQTLRCIAEGCSTKEAAARLGIRFKTAACHRYRIMQKLGVHDTTSLVRFAIRCGIVRL
jgi:DNA-binding NarL/FixJ family response regulator